MLKKNGVSIKKDQVCCIGKGTQKLVKETNNLDFDIGNEVYINSFAGFESLITVQDIKTGTRFDVTPRNLGVLVREQS
jgi:co-chaperonin GroES (HSP10)